MKKQTTQWAEIQEMIDDANEVGVDASVIVEAALSADCPRCFIKMVERSAKAVIALEGLIYGGEEA